MADCHIFTWQQPSLSSPNRTKHQSENSQVSCEIYHIVTYISYNGWVSCTCKLCNLFLL